ncbi:MAG: PEGA domain-containing protein [Candidatus Daviesbacteria bacterium]
MSKHFIITLATLIIIALGAGIAIFFTKGYSFSAKNGGLIGTGIISATSHPDGASVYIDGHLTTATNTNISNLSPKIYKIKIAKDGFIPWEKDVQVTEGLVSEIKATLFPALPTLYPLTVSGAESPVLSPDGGKLAFAVPFSSDGRSRQKGGIWVWTMTSTPIAFARGAEPHQIVISTTDLDFAKATLAWSPDSKQLLVSLQEGGVEGEANARNYLLSSDGQTSVSNLRDITPTLASTLKNWKDDQKVENETRVASIKDLNTRKIASDSATVKWSPDETKFMVREKTAKVYDLEDKKEYQLPEADTYLWLPDSLHVILVSEGKISVCEFDGGNTAVIYAGKFDEANVFPWPDSSRLVFLTSFDTPSASNPNLFGINLK